MKNHCLMCDEELPEKEYWASDICVVCISVIEEADYNEARAQVIEEERERQC